MRVRTFILAVVAAFCALPLAAFEGRDAAVDSVSNAVGVSFGHDIGVSIQRLVSLGVPVDIDVFLQAAGKELRGDKGMFTVEEANAWLDRYIASSRPNELEDVLDEASQQAFLDSIAALSGAVRFPDGLVMIVELEGEGAMPVDSDTVRLLYTGRYYDGQVFDATSSPIEFKVTEVMPGFSEGLKQMRPGGRYRLAIPSNLAYGREGIPGAVPGNAALDFTVNLLEVKP